MTNGFKKIKPDTFDSIKEQSPFPNEQTFKNVLSVLRV